MLVFNLKKERNEKLLNTAIVEDIVTIIEINKTRLDDICIFFCISISELLREDKN